MPVVMKIRIPKIIPMNDLSDILARVYKDYVGTKFYPVSIEITVKGVNGLIELRSQDDEAISKLKQYGNRIRSFWLNPTRNPSLNIVNAEDTYPSISFETRFIYSRTIEEAIEARKTFEDILGFAKLLMKYSGAFYFYGGCEAWGDITESDDVQLIYCKGKYYISMLQGHIENRFGVVLSEGEIERIVRKTATITTEGEYTTVCFFRIEPRATFGPGNAFYEAVKSRMKEQK